MAHRGSTNPAVPCINGRYQVVKVLGKGGMGEVLLVEDLFEKDSKKLLALKLLALDEVQGSQVLAWFKREFHTLTTLHHPGIAAVYDFGREQEGGRPFYTSEYIKGEDLYQATRCMTLEQQLQVLNRICLALAYIHAKGVLHNDLKTNNILLEDESQMPKILDFGLSFLLEGKSSAIKTSLGFQGTPSYAAPELLRGEPPSFQTDLFALGIVFYRILTGQLPHQGKSMDDLLQCHLEGEFPSPKKINPSLQSGLESLILSLLAKDPKDRPRSSEDVSGALALASDRPLAGEREAEAVGDFERAELIGRERPWRLLQNYIRKKIPKLLQEDATEVIDWQSTSAEEYTFTDFSSQKRLPLFAVLQGGLGLGKTVLLNQIKHHYQLLELPFLLVSCKSSSTVFSPWRRLLREMEMLLKKNSTVLQQFSSLFQYIVHDDVSHAKEFGDFDRTGFFMRLAQLLSEAFAEKPFILALDDADAGDEISMAFLEYLNRLQSEEHAFSLPPILLALEHKEKGAFLRNESFLAVPLLPLTLAECKMLLKKVFLGANVPEKLGSLFFERSGGNPFFIQELLRELIAKHHVVRRHGQWNLEDIKLESISVSPTLKDLLSERYRRLGPLQKKMLSVAAIFQEPISPFEWQALCEVEEEALEKGLAVLRREEMVQLEEGKKWSFAQGAFADVVREQLKAEETKQLHLRTAGVLEKRKSKPFEKLAVHYAHAEVPSLASTFALEAARECQRLFAQERALTFYQLALDQAKQDESGEERLICALAGLADVSWRKGDQGKALGYYQALLDQTAPESWTAERSQSHRALGIAARNRAQYREAVSHFEKAIVELGRKSPALRASFHAQIALAYERAGEKSAAESSREKALELVSGTKKLGEDAIPVFLTLAPFFKNTGAIGKAKEMNEKVLEIAERIEDRKNAATALNNLGALTATSGNYSAALRILERNLGLCRKMGDAIRLCNCLNSLGKLEYLGGHYRQAALYLVEALHLSESVGDLNLAAGIHAALGQLETERGNYLMAQNHLHQAHVAYRETKNRKGIPFVKQSLANLYYVTGKTNEARTLAQKTLLQTDDIGLQFYLLLTAIRAALKSEDYRAAQTFLQRAKEKSEGVATNDWKMFLLLAEIDLAFHSGKESGPLFKTSAALEKKVFDQILLCRYRLLTLQIHFHTKKAVNQNSEKNQISLAKQLVEDLASKEIPNLYWRSLHLLGEIQLSINQTLEAAESFKIAKEIVMQLATNCEKEGEKIFLADPEVRGFLDQFDRFSSSSEFMSQELKDSQLLNQKLFRLLEINRQLAVGWQSRTRLLEYILDIALELTGARRGFVVLRKANNEWTIAAARNLAAKENWDPQGQWSLSIVEEVFRTARTQVILDAGSDTQLRKNKSISGLHLRSVLCVPMRSGADLVGVLYVDDDEEQGRFQKTEVDLLTALADQASMALKQIDSVSRLVQSIEDTTTELRRMQSIVKQQNHSLEWKYSYARIVGGKDPSMKRVFNLLDRVVPTHSNVLIQGESGTGKELVAQAIHYNGPRKDKPFVSINCAGLNPMLLESELFGHVKGAFTGAEFDHEGMMLVAHGGTLFLDEIGDMPLEVQAKLLRTLQDGEIRPVGSDKVYKVNVRFISASNKSLEDLVKKEMFRGDFFYRLNVVQIDLPALRDREGDLDLLLDHFMQELCKKTKRPQQVLTSRARDALHRYSWPGNVRELYNVLEGVVTLKQGKKIDVSDLPVHIRDFTSRESEELLDLEHAKEIFLKEYLQKVLQQTRGNVSKAAKKAGVHRRSLYRMLERLGLVEKGSEREDG